MLDCADDRVISVHWLGCYYKEPIEMIRASAKMIGQRITLCSKLGGPRYKGRRKVTRLEVVSKDLKELGVCSVEVLDRMRLKQLV